MKRTSFFIVALLASIEAFAAEPTHRISLVSDPHVSDQAKDSAYVRHFQAVIDEVNAANVDAVLLSGDLTQGGSAEQMRRYVEMEKLFRAPVVRHVPGNHDVGHKVMADTKTTLS